jgi:hypothetical protein
MDCASPPSRGTALTASTLPPAMNSLDDTCGAREALPICQHLLTAG